MNPINSETTLGDLVAARPEVAARLESFGIDYCCGGQRSLGSAVYESGLDLLDVISALETVPVSDTAPVWYGIDGLVDHLVDTHHEYLREALPRLVALSAKVAGVHGGRHPELHTVESLVAELSADLLPHLTKEEQVLFPMIRELATATTLPIFHCGSVANPIRMMELEHDTAGDLLAQLRTVTAGYTVPDDGCASYHALYAGLEEVESDTHLHVHKENNILFPDVIAAEQALGSLIS